MTAPKLTRRQFLKLAGIAGTLAVPTLLGYDLLQDAEGDPPPRLSPYAPVEILENWSSLPAAVRPILLLINERSDNPFGLYLAEILRAEGLNCFWTARLSDMDRIPLERFDLILLAEGPLSANQAKRLESYVAQGGRLIAMRPDVRLAPLLGLQPTGGTTAEGYLQVEASHPVGRGIATETLQFHGVADHYRLAGADAVAWLHSDRATRTSFPAVTIYRSGEGWAAMWAFDLARSVAYTRQGNPAWANQEQDGANYIRACDMFVGWMDPERIPIPQADEQQRLLVNLLAFMSQEGPPLPRLGYLPGMARAILIATGDSHNNPTWAIENALKRVERYGGRMSIYYSPPLSPGHWRRAGRRTKRWAEGLPLVGEALAGPYTLPTPSHIANWRARGHEFTVHPYVDDGLEQGWDTYWREFTGLGYGPISPTVRTHRILWTGWVETARLQVSYGIGLNLDYYHWGPAFRTETEEWVYGHFTGSGLPMKFVDEQGRVLNIYQQLTQLTDEHLLAFANGPARLLAEDAVTISRNLLRSSLDRFPAAIVAQFHTDPFIQSGSDLANEAGHWMEGTLEYAATHGIPIWSAAEWLRFTEVRHDAALEEVQWHPETRRLSFQLVTQAVADAELTLMVPLEHGGARLSQVEVEGRPVPYSERRVGGIPYGCMSVRAGSYSVVATYA